MKFGVDSNQLMSLVQDLIRREIQQKSAGVTVDERRNYIITLVQSDVTAAMVACRSDEIADVLLSGLSIRLSSLLVVQSTAGRKVDNMGSYIDSVATRYLDAFDGDKNQVKDYVDFLTAAAVPAVSDTNFLHLMEIRQMDEDRQAWMLLAMAGMLAVVFEETASVINMSNNDLLDTLA